MDFNRGQQPFRSNPTQTTAETTPKPAKRKKALFGDKFSKVTFLIILIASTFVAFGAIVLLLLPNDKSMKYVDDTAYQTISVMGGAGGESAVYFGKITSINDSQIVLTNVFVPQKGEDNSAVTTLVPFVCTVASPTDQMVVNKSQVVYWFNLQSEGKVTKTINDYKKSNNGTPNCDNLTSAAGSDTESNAADTPAANTPATTPTTPSTTPKTP